MARVPMWIEKAGRAMWNGRDDRGHFDTVDRVSEARFHGHDAPKCPHPCCKGRRPHPAGLPVMRKRTGSSPSKPRRSTKRDAWGTDRTLGQRARQKPAAARAETRRRNAGHDYAVYLEGQYHAAEKATRGHMVNAAGRRKGIRGQDFFRPGARPSVEKWGSDELRAWFGSGNVAAGHRRGRGVLTRTAWETQQRKAG